ncbi:potassium/sodium hyperpolarization-activated cyclic nucleotide-gated channel 1 [Histomonas meleagridis]|uniref:potassium/sodium hyperpolarization-activated cyclic nucleotide-gated channel 1 n=1 Tax=Histomonas meleagridis TaxID=135588 RepID=UPI003559C8A5|nr:potassium/sodium hyperpolarization-activated cyclic nucleotide-gated channel 1 [Histomonas meleagridis]KAH0797878.1 potassium/sodium hyperpolarization-activated cyclic nucleotide-gated channel 1 [Histomonas meleagridis]
MESDNSQNIPMFWDLINDVDKAAYLKIQNTLASSACKHRRHHSKAINNDILLTIKSFILRGDEDDWKRSLVCGIGWINDSVVINTRQLRILISKCKSSINAMFQNSGYVTVSTTNEFSSAMSQYYPAIKDNFSEIRKWTVRCLKDHTADNHPVDNTGTGNLGEYIPDVNQVSEEKTPSPQQEETQ